MKKLIDNPLLALVILMMCLIGCAPTPKDIVDSQEPLCTYPDYQNITIPCNIAPLNFMMRSEQVDAIAISIEDKNNQQLLQLKAKGRKAIWPNNEWRELLAKHAGDSLYVTVIARQEGQWLRYPSFKWIVSTDSIDSYLTYRLIEPGYEVWDNVCIEERCLESFDTKMIADGHELGNRCMNCHTHGGDRGQYSFFHLRGTNGGTILFRNGNLRKLTLRNNSMQSGAVYGDFHPSGQYAVYSTNVIIPAFHSQANRRLEVYDTSGDLCVADFEHNKLSTHTSASELISFPCFSADGHWIYYCATANPCGDTIPSANDLLDHVDELHYSLYRMPFDATTGLFDSQNIELVYDANKLGGSVNLPKYSNEGDMLCFSLSAYGTFPIWHRETRLCILKNGNVFNTGENGTYHSWSHNSRWIAFASKRNDWQYGRVYFMHIDDIMNESSSTIQTSKPFVLPQADPENDDLNLRSFNIPDLSTQSMPFGTKEVKLLLKEGKAEAFE